MMYNWPRLQILKVLLIKANPTFKEELSFIIEDRLPLSLS